GCANVCEIVFELEYAVSAVPSSKFHLYFGFTPFCVVAVYETDVPATAIVVAGSGFRINAAAPLIVHVNDTGVELNGSLTVTVTLNVLAVVGVPVMRPVELLMLRPVGRPVAAYVSASPFGSVAAIVRSTAVPVAPVSGPGFVTEGGEFVFV